MNKAKPQELAQQNRQAFVQGQFMKINDLVFKAGLTVGEITQVLQALGQNLNSLPVGESIKEEAPKEDKK